MGKKGPAIFSSALRLVQAACGLVLLIFVPWKLFSTNGIDLKEIPDVVQDPNLDDLTKCLFDSGESTFLSGSTFCLAIIGFAIASMIFSAIASCAKFIFKCVTLNACGVSNIIVVVADLILGAAWAVAFYLVFTRGTAANEANWPEEAARNGVIAAAFFGSFTYFLDAIVSCCLVGPSTS